MRLVSNVSVEPSSTTELFMLNGTTNVTQTLLYRVPEGRKAFFGVMFFCADAVCNLSVSFHDPNTSNEVGRQDFEYRASRGRISSITPGSTVYPWGSYDDWMKRSDSSISMTYRRIEMYPDQEVRYAISASTPWSFVYRIIEEDLNS